MNRCLKAIHLEAESEVLSSMREERSEEREATKGMDERVGVVLIW